MSNFFVRRYPFSFLTILSPKIYTVFCFSVGTSFSLFLVFLPCYCLLFSSSFFFPFLLLFSERYSRFLFLSLILSESNFSAILLFCWFLVLSKFLFDFVLVSKSKVLYNYYLRDKYGYWLLYNCK